MTRVWAKVLGPKGVTVNAVAPGPVQTDLMRANLDDPASLEPALRGIEIASLATSPTPLLAEQEGNFIEAARAARLRRLVKLSGFGIEFSSDRRTERFPR